MSADRLRPPAGAELARFSQAVRQAMSFLSCRRSRSSESRRAFVASSCFFNAAICRGGISEACAIDLILAQMGPCASNFPCCDAESATASGRLLSGLQAVPASVAATPLNRFRLKFG